MTQTVSISFFRFDSIASRVWAFAMMGLARPFLKRLPDIGFWKLCGSGTGEGFTPIPNTGVYAILAVWPDAEVARQRTTSSGIFRTYRARASEAWTVFLSPTSSRGEWSGKKPFSPKIDTKQEALAALTRATIKPRAALRFWRRVPSISTVIGDDPNVLFKIGIGEIPLFHQITFSIWPGPQSMADFARKDGPHARAIRAVRDGDWFREELYARFAITGDDGTWGGKSPIKQLETLA